MPRFRVVEAAAAEVRVVGMLEEEVVFDLHHVELPAGDQLVQDLVLALDAKAQVPHQALVPELFELLQNAALAEDLPPDLRTQVGAVQLDEVDAVPPQVPEAALQGGAHLLGIGREGLCRQEDLLLRDAGEALAEDLLARAVAIAGRRVEVVDAQLVGAAYGGHDALAVRLLLRIKRAGVVLQARRTRSGSPCARSFPGWNRSLSVPPRAFFVAGFGFTQTNADKMPVPREFDRFGRAFCGFVLPL